jgi:protein tyrosine/serine phosphatase
MLLLLVVAPAVSAPAIRIDNFGRINTNDYRGGQPLGRDYGGLAALGIHTVIDLQADGANDDEARLVEAAGMRFHRIPMTTRVPPTVWQLAQFLSIVNDPTAQPVFVYCKGRKHRTGVMTAVYRMEQDRWTADQAFREMKGYKFGLDFLHPEFKQFVYTYRPAGLARVGAAASPITNRQSRMM